MFILLLLIVIAKGMLCCGSVAALDALSGFPCFVCIYQFGREHVTRAFLSFYVLRIARLAFVRLLWPEAARSRRRGKSDIA